MTHKTRNLSLSIMLLLVIVSCSDSPGANSGVASLEDAGTVVQIKGSQSEDTSMQTDEQIVTDFASCVREHGITIPDPEINSDGTVDFQKLRSDIFNDPNFEGRSSRDQLQECFSILQAATFVQARQEEDPIELQDNLLKVTSCIRENGLDVPDPDFSEGPRGSMRPVIGELDMENERIRDIVSGCRDSVFSGTEFTRRGPGRPMNNSGQNR